MCPPIIKHVRGKIIFTIRRLCILKFYVHEDIDLTRSELVAPKSESTFEYYGYGVLLCDRYTRKDGQIVVDVWWPAPNVTTNAVRIKNLSSQINLTNCT